jgi:hypothetical protein
MGQEYQCCRRKNESQVVLSDMSVAMSNTRSNDHEDLYIEKKKKKKKKKMWRKTYNTDFDLQPIPADGNCLFRALAGKDYDVLRKSCVNWISKNRDNIHDMKLCEWLKVPNCEPPGFDSKNPDSYLEFMRKDGSWGGTIEIHAASHVLQRNIIVLVKEDNLFHEFYRTDLSLPSTPLYILYNGDTHYTGLVKSSTSTTTASSRNLINV